MSRVILGGKHRKRMRCQYEYLDVLTPINFFVTNVNFCPTFNLSNTCIPEFSIVLASRSRTALLENLVDSIHNTSSDINSVEILVGIDDDDSETHSIKKSLEASYPFATLYSRKRSPMLNKDYINWLAGISRGKYIIVCNDDTVFVTHHWDKVLLDRISKYLDSIHDGIFYGSIHDGVAFKHCGASYCCFPLISRKAFEALGWVMPPEFPSWGADYACWRIFENVGRIVDLSGVHIDHISVYSGKRDRDSISYHVENLWKQNRYDGMEQPIISKYTAELKNKIGKKWKEYL